MTDTARTDPTSVKVYLDIPAIDLAKAKALGVSWDKLRRQWWTFGEIALRNRHTFKRWLPTQPLSISRSWRQRQQGYVCINCGAGVLGERTSCPGRCNPNPQR